MAITVGSVQVEVVPDARGFIPKLSRELAPQTRALGDEIGRDLGERISAGINESITDGFHDAPTAPAKSAGGKQGKAFGGEFNRSIQKALSGALQALPPLNIGAATSAADQELRDISARIRDLQDVRIGVDMDAGQFMAEAALVREQVNRLDRDDVTIDVRVNAAGAAGELAAIEALSGEGGGGGGISKALGNVRTLHLAIAGLALALIPIGGLAVGAFAAIAAGAVAALGALAVLVLAFQGIAEAVKATSKAQDSAAKDAAAAAQKQVQAARAVESANRSLGGAQRALQDAQAQVGITAQRAAAGVAAAYAAQIRAVRSLADAQRQAQQAQRDLTQARIDERQALRDLEDQQKHGAIDAQQATLDLQLATINLQNTLADPTSTAGQRTQAQIDYDNAVLRLQDLNQQNADLAQQKADADREGVDGSQAVQDALQGVVDANQDVIDAQAAVRQSSVDVVAAQVDGARAVAAAQQQVVDAQAGLVVAQQAVADATRDQADALNEVSTSAQAARDAMSKLSPAGQTFAAFVSTTLIPAFKELVGAAQAGFLPGLQRGLEALMPVIGPLSAFVERLGSALGNVFADVAAAMNGPAFTAFFNYIGQIAGPAMDGLATILLNLGGVFGQIIVAFGPFSAQLGQGLVDLTTRFSEFAAGLSTNADFQAFLAWLQANGPTIAEQVWNIARAVGDLIVAAAPLGMALLGGLSALATAIHAIPTPVLTVLVGVVGSLVLGLITIVKLAGPVEALIGLFGAEGALAGAFAWIGPAVEGIGAAFSAIVPIFEGLAAAVAAIAAVIGLPVEAVIAIIAVLIAAIVLLIVYWDDVTAAAGRAWDWIVLRAQAVWTWLSQNWRRILDVIIWPFQRAYDYLTGWFASLGRAVQGAYNTVVQWFGALFRWFASFPSTLGGIFAHMWDGLVGAFRWAINQIIAFWNGLDFTVPTVSIAGHQYGGWSIGVPDIPYLADGGIVYKPTLALLGEAGPEAVVPLGNMVVPGFSHDGAAPAPAGAPQVRVFIGQTELTDIVRTEVVAADSDNARQIVYGRRA